MRSQVPLLIHVLLAMLSGLPQSFSTGHIYNVNAWLFSLCCAQCYDDRHCVAHLAAVAHDARQAAREEQHVQQRLEGVAVQVRNGEGKLLHVLRDALVRVCQPCRGSVPGFRVVSEVGFFKLLRVYTLLCGVQAFKLFSAGDCCSTSSSCQASTCKDTQLSDLADVGRLCEQAW